MAIPWRRLAGRLSAGERLIVASTGAGIGLAILMAIWHITLVAPQYPQGLHVWIRAGGVTGDLQAVDILNHYVGMKPLTPQTFPEFAWLPVALLGLCGLHLLAAALGRREMVLAAWIALATFDLYMLWDFYQWLYDWGHTLDPRAPMRLVPFTPPVIGFKQVANFRIWSLPAVGGWVIVLASLVTPLLAWRWLAGSWPWSSSRGQGPRSGWWPRARASRRPSSRPDRAA